MQVWLLLWRSTIKRRSDILRNGGAGGAVGLLGECLKNWHNSHGSDKTNTNQLKEFLTFHLSLEQLRNSIFYQCGPFLFYSAYIVLF